MCRSRTIYKKSQLVSTDFAFILNAFIGKDQLEALKNIKKVNEPIYTPEEKASIVNKAEIKGQGFQMTMVSSEKGRQMIED